jgi:hypothetical protein
MIKLILLTVFLLAGSYPLGADEPGGDQEFSNDLDNIKNPFEDGIPKPVVVVPETAVHHEETKPVIVKPKPVIIAPPVIKLPAIKVQGVIVGEGVYQAIINDQVVSLYGDIKGAKVISVTKQGVGLLYKGKKFFLDVD